MELVGRLENIIARNQRPAGARERFAIMVGFAVLVFVVAILMMFTDLGVPPTPARDPAAGPGSAAPPRARRVDGVFLGTPARPAQR
jgi:hypothetical protein